MSEMKFTPPEAQMAPEEKKKNLLKQLLSPEIKKLIFSIIFKFKINTASAEDISQEVLFKAHKAIESGKFEEREAKLKSWLYRIVQNECINLLRKEKRSPQNNPNTTEINEGIISSPLPTAEDLLEQKMRGEKLKELVAKLNPKLKGVMDLYLQGYTQEEIGDRLGMDRSTVGTTTFRAKKRMLELLEEE